MFYSILNGSFSGELYAMNPKEDEIQGQHSFRNLEELPNTDLAILAIPAKLCTDTVEYLAVNKRTKAFIIISAGFSEENEEGALIEKRITEI